uniref:Uncharacterized protein n=1 Tax=Triticum urartu TaxID=4572 RepID=A0A8R7TV56_TRIUA
MLLLPSRYEQRSLELHKKFFPAASAPLKSSHTQRRDYCFLLEKAWCLVGVCVVPTPAFSIKTSRKRDHLKIMQVQLYNRMHFSLSPTIAAT